MSMLPRISGREVVAALMKVGYARDQQKGGHIVLRQTAYPHRRIVVPDHAEVAKRLRGQSRLAGSCHTQTRDQKEEGR